MPLEFAAVKELACTLEPPVVAPSQTRLQRAFENISENSSGMEDVPVVDVLKVNEQPLPQRPGRNYNPNR